MSVKKKWRRKKVWLSTAKDINYLDIQAEQEDRSQNPSCMDRINNSSVKAGLVL